MNRTQKNFHGMFFQDPSELIMNLGVCNPEWATSFISRNPELMAEIKELEAKLESMSHIGVELDEDLWVTGTLEENQEKQKYLYRAYDIKVLIVEDFKKHSKTEKHPKFIFKDSEEYKNHKKNKKQGL